MNDLYFIFDQTIARRVLDLVGVIFTVVAAISIVTVAVVSVLLPHIQHAFDNFF